MVVVYKYEKAMVCCRARAAKWYEEELQSIRLY